MRRQLAWIALLAGGALVTLAVARHHGSLAPSRRSPLAPETTGFPGRKLTITLELLGSSGQYGPLGCHGDVMIAEPQDRPLLSETVNLYLDEFHTRLAPLLRQRSPLADALVPLLADSPEADLEQLFSLPERRVAGFDYAVGALLTRSVGAYRLGQPDRSLRWAEAAVRANDRVVAAHAWQALLFDRTEQPAPATEALRRAQGVDRQVPAVALALGLRLAHTDEATAAATALASYLEAYPTDEAIVQLRRRLELQAQLQASYRRFENGGLTVMATPALAAADAESLLALLDDGLTQTARLMGRPRRPQLTAVVYATREELLATTCSTPWTGAVFDGTLRLELGSRQQPGGWEGIVRHEAVHAQLHYGAPGAPTWLHEGLAQHLARQRPQSLWESYHRMATTGTFIPLASMAGSFMVIDDNDDALLAYHQSLAMVDTLIGHEGPPVIARAVDLLRGGTDPEQLLEELTEPPLTGADLLRHIRAQLQDVPQPEGSSPDRSRP